MGTRKGSSSGRKSIALLLAVVACASQSGGIATPPSSVDRVHVESQHIDYDIASKVEGSEARATVQFPPATVWRALAQVYSELPIPVETADPGHRFLSGAVTARRTFANKSLSHFFDCGSTVMGPNANAYNVRIHVQSQVDSVGAAESNVRTLVSSTAASDGGITVRCASRGDLERLIVDQIGELLGKPAPTSY
jgi:hypothetical protein